MSSKRIDRIFVSIHYKGLLIMAKPYDAAGKELMELKPEAFLQYVNVPVTGPVSLIESDFSTVTAQVDSVFSGRSRIPVSRSYRTSSKPRRRSSPQAQTLQRHDRLSS